MIEFLGGPGFLSDRSTIGSDISYFFAIGFIASFLYAGWRARRHRGLAHHRAILASFALMTAYLVYYYEVRRLGLASFADQAGFPGPQWVYRKLFHPVLYAHFFAVSSTIFLSIYMVISGFRTARRQDGRMVLKGGKAPISIWLWAVGLVWLLFLSWWVIFVHRFGWGYAIMFMSIGWFIPAGVAVMIRRIAPEPAVRHRMLGQLCIALFWLLMVTTTLTYYMLYVARY